MKKVILTAIILTSTSAFTKDVKTKSSYIYKAVIALNFLNREYNSESIESQCKKLGGEIISKAERASSESAMDSLPQYAGVCRIPDKSASLEEDTPECTGSISSSSRSFKPSIGLDAGDLGKALKPSGGVAK